MTEAKKPLSICNEHEIVKIKKLELEGTMRRRLLDTGFVRGAIVE